MDRIASIIAGLIVSVPIVAYMIWLAWPEPIDKPVIVFEDVPHPSVALGGPWVAPGWHWQCEGVYLSDGVTPHSHRNCENAVCEEGSQLCAGRSQDYDFVYRARS